MWAADELSQLFLSDIFFERLVQAMIEWLKNPPGCNINILATKKTLDLVGVMALQGIPC